MPDFVEHRLLQGQGAGRWLPFARSKVAILHQRARAAGMTALSQRWQLDGGDVDCAVRVVGDQRYIHIRRKTCPPFAGGLVDAILNPIFAVYPFVALNPLVEITPQGDPNPQFALQRFFPSERDAGSTPRAFHNEPRLGRNVNAAAQLASIDVAIVKAGQYSGEMRKVVQVLQGLNEVVEYSPLYALTHGVFVSGNGTRWVIEITVNGVVAWIMNVCTAQPVTAENGDVLLPYTPLPSPKPKNEDIPAAIAAGSFKILSDSAAVLDFYTKNPFFLHCGWAFSGDGHEAANVCFDYVGATAQSYLFKITITEDKNAPTTATMSLVEKGLLFGTKSVHMKYPLPNGNLYSFDTRGPVPVVSNAVVYCWYDGAELIVARYEFSPGSSSETLSFPPGPPFCDSELNRDLKSGTASFTAVPSLSISGHVTPSQTTSFSGSTARADVSGVAGGALSDFFAGAGGMAVTEIFNASQSSRSGVVDSQSVRATLIIPFFDREAAYLAVERGSITSSGSTFSAPRFASNGLHIFGMCAETCAGIPSRCVRVLSGGDGQALPPSFCDTGGSGNKWGFNQTSSYWPGGQYGGTINPSIQDGAGCAAIPTPNFDLGPGFTFNPLPVDVRDYTFEFLGSGGANQALPLPKFPTELVGFIEEGVFQRAVAFRDAFNGKRYMISSSTQVEGPTFSDQFILRDDAGYPLADILGNPAWIGVP